MTRTSMLMLPLLGVLFGCSEPAKQSAAPAQKSAATETAAKVEKFEPTWESVKQKKTPEWFLDAKFGIYFHWGPYSVPAYETEWYSTYMYREGHPVREYHEQKYGPLSEFGYKDFIPMFTAEKFDAEAWADLFVKAGARFAGPVAEHADGFSMWDSELTKWNSVDMGPKRDVVGEMGKALRARDVKFVTTFHHMWNYAWYTTWDENTDAYNPEYAGLYGPRVPEGTFKMADEPTDPLPDAAWNKLWIDKVKEVVNKYEPDLVYFDNKMDIVTEQTRLDFLSFYYNAGIEQNRDVVVTYKFTDLQAGSAVLDLERARMSEKKDFPWLTDDSVDWKAWCHIDDPDYKSADRLIDFLIDVVSKNGNVLLNVTPTAQGEIPQPVQERLLEMGAWLDQNGEAIYGTRPWKIFGEGPAEVVEGHLSERQNADNTAKDIRFTTKDGFLYAIVLAWPSEPVAIKALAKGKQQVSSVEYIGSSEKVSWKQTDQGLIIDVPKQKVGNHAFSFKIAI